MKVQIEKKGDRLPHFFWLNEIGYFQLDGHCDVVTIIAFGS